MAQTWAPSTARTAMNGNRCNHPGAMHGRSPRQWFKSCRAAALPFPCLSSTSRRRRESLVAIALDAVGEREERWGQYSGADIGARGSARAESEEGRASVTLRAVNGDSSGTSVRWYGRPWGEGASSGLHGLKFHHGEFSFPTCWSWSRMVRAGSSGRKLGLGWRARNCSLVRPWRSVVGD